MKKLIFLLAASVVCINCGAPAANTSNAANKPANSASNSSVSNTSASNSSSTSNSMISANAPSSNAELDFTLVNKTGYAIKKVYIGPTANKDWAEEDEVLKGKSFPDGASFDIKFHPRASAKNWDIMVEWADGSPSEEWDNLDLTKIDKVTLHYDKAKDKTTADIE